MIEWWYGDCSDPQPATHTNTHRVTVSMQLLFLSHMSTISDSLEPESSHHKARSDRSKANEGKRKINSKGLQYLFTRFINRRNSKHRS